MPSSITTVVGVRIPNAFLEISNEACELGGFESQSHLCRHFLMPWLRTITDMVNGDEPELPDLKECWAKLEEIQLNRTGQTKLDM